MHGAATFSRIGLVGENAGEIVDAAIGQMGLADAVPLCRAVKVRQLQEGLFCLLVFGAVGGDPALNRAYPAVRLRRPRVCDLLHGGPAPEKARYFCAWREAVVGPKRHLVRCSGLVASGG